MLRFGRDRIPFHQGGSDGPDDFAGLVLAVGVLWAGKEFTTQARRVWRVVWPHESQLKAAVDEPTDAVNRQLAQVSGVSAEVWAAVLCAMLEALLTGLADLGVDQAQSDGRNEEVTH